MIISQGVNNALFRFAKEKKRKNGTCRGLNIETFMNVPLSLRVCEQCTRTPREGNVLKKHM